MKTKLFKIITAIAILIFSLSFFSATTGVYADSGVCGNSNIPLEVRKANGCPEAGGNKNELKPAIQSILYSIIAISGLVAVIFVLIGGYNYMTSTGDAAKLEKAKKTILYACIGLAVCALAFVITNWAISVVNNNTSQSPDTSQEEKQSDSDNK